MNGPVAESLLTVDEAVAGAAERLAEAGVATPRRDARLLLAAALECEPGWLLGWPDEPVTPGARARFDAMIGARVARKPVSRILGRRQFWSLSLAVTAHTLDPRPESETLVEAVLARLGDRYARLRLLDLGTGSGCLLLALLSELKNAFGVGVDRDREAIRVARENARAAAVAARTAFFAGDWAHALDGGFDVVVCNPPYVTDTEMAGLPPEVARYDPPLALRAGQDGLAAYRAVVPALPALLAPGGIAALEIGPGQAMPVQALLAAYGLRTEAPVRDLAGRPRCVCATQEQV